MRKIFGCYLASLIIILATPGCKKEPVTDNPIDNVFNISFSRNALEYVNIPVGKYFIYKIPGDPTMDSVIVVSNDLVMVNMPRNDNMGFPEHNIERFRIRFNKYDSSFAGPATILSQWILATTIPAPLSPYDSTSTADLRLEFFSGPHIGQAIFYGTHDLAGTETLTVEGITYTNVIKTESDNGLPVSDPLYTKEIFYWARGVGIIKRISVGFNGYQSIMNLVRHN